MSLNKMLLIGNVGSDPEMRYLPNGNPVTTFSIATNRRYTTSDGERREETEWFRVSAWGRLAEQVNQYVTKGKRVYVEGRLKSSPWIGNDGQARAGNDITANQVLFLDRAGAPDAESGKSEKSEAPGSGGPSAGDVEDLPW